MAEEAIDLRVKPPVLLSGHAVKLSFEYLVDTHRLVLRSALVREAAVRSERRLMQRLRAGQNAEEVTIE